MLKSLKFFKLGAILLALFLSLPILGIFIEILLSLFFGDFSNTNLSQDLVLNSIKDNLYHFFSYLFLKFVQDTFFVSLGVLSLSIILGVSTSYLIANFNFYFSNLLEKLLILPLAIPAYILAFVYVGIMDFKGLFHQIFGFRIDFFNIYGVIFVLAFSLYPYVYLFAKAAFKSEAKEAFEAAKMLGFSEWKFFYKIGIVAIKPAILSSSMLVLMETLSDYGASAYLGVDTFSAGIFKLWYDLSDSYSASLLSGLLMLFIFFLMYAEYLYKIKKKYSFNQNLELFLQKRTLSKLGQFFASLYCFIIVLLGFILPLIWLLYWGLKDEKILQTEFYIIILQTLVLAFISALFILILALFFNFVARILKNSTLAVILVKISSLGYAIPGAAVGISVMILFVYLGKMSGILFLGQSFIVLIFAYVVRFLATAIYSLESGYTKIHTNLDQASLNLKPSYLTLFFRVHLPLLRHFLFLAFIVVFIDIIKELPLSRILSPFGFETLSVKAFWYASDERIYNAALPSLFIVLLSLVAVIWIQIITRKNDARN